MGVETVFSYISVEIDVFKRYKSFSENEILNKQ